MSSTETAAGVDPAPAAPALLLHPRGGDASLLTERAMLLDLAGRLRLGRGPVALDAERASGYRYSSRAYLVQLRRDDVGTALLDPIALGDLTVLDEPLASAEWVLHAAGQDLPCLAEIGISPRTLFDTELAGRLAGLPRVGLAPIVEHMLGFGLLKGHGAADWSVRPLPDDWLTYAALDVEVLVELRDALESLLAAQGKLDWARQEFAAILAAPPRPPRVDPWRRTSGIHHVHDRRALAVIRDLWDARDGIARSRDLAPHRVLPDSAMVGAAGALPATAAELIRLPVFGGRMQRRHADVWMAAIDHARALPDHELPPVHQATVGPPPAAKWAAKDPAAASRLIAAKAGLAELSERVSVPVENLISPGLLRSVLWEPPMRADVPAVLAAGGARQWQIAMIGPVVAAALDAPGSPTPLLDVQGPLPQVTDQ